MTSTPTAPASTSRPHQRIPVAVIGMEGVFPGARNIDQYWGNIVSGVRSFEDLPDDRVDPSFRDPRLTLKSLTSTSGGFLDPDFSVDAAALGIMPSDIKAMEPDQLFTLAAAVRAIKDTNGAFDKADRTRVGVILGKGGYAAPGAIRAGNRSRVSHQVVRTIKQIFPDIDDEALRALRRNFEDQVETYGAPDAIGTISNMCAARVANRLNLGGPSYAVDGACASSLIALDHAIDELDQGRCDLMLAGGVHHCQDISLWGLFTDLGALSKSGRMDPFGEAADGTVLSEGTGVVVLKPLEAAERDGDRVYAVIEGVGVSSDGRSTSVVNPSSPSQQRAMRNAWQEAGLDPAEDPDLRLVEAHATATTAGDKTELQSMSAVFGDDAEHPLAVGSAKAIIGHTMAAAGIAGLIKACLALYHETLPPLGGLGDTREELRTGHFRGLSAARPWTVRHGATVRRAAVSAFGFGGINAHAVLSRRVDAEPAPDHDHPLAALEHSRRARLFAGRTPAELIEKLELGARDGALEHSREFNEDAPACRAAIYEPDERKIKIAIATIKSGMKRFVSQDIACFTEPVLDESSRVVGILPGLEPGLEPRIGDLAPWFGSPVPDAEPHDVVDQSRQLFEVEALVARGLEQFGVVPDALAGTSLGEITAATLTGVLPTDLTSLVLDRLSPELLGTAEDRPFALLAGPRDAVERLIEAQRAPITLTHDNAPEQCLVCGPRDDLFPLLDAARAEGILGRVLPLGSGLHTPQMEPFGKALDEGLKKVDVGAPSTEVWSARTASRLPDDPEALRHNIARCVVEPVRLRETVEALWRTGARAFIQMGPGTTAGLVSQTLGDHPHLAVAANVANRPAGEQLAWVSLCLWAAGYRRPAARPRDARPVLIGRDDPQIPTAVPLRLGSPLVDIDYPERGAARAAILSLAARGHSPIPQAGQDPRATPRARAAGVVHSSPPKPSMAPRLDPAAAHRSTMTISTELMPYLRDHSFFRQAPDWPDEQDRTPVMPGTATLVLMESQALEQAPAGRIIEVDDVRLLRWLHAAPAQDVTILTAAAGDHETVEILGVASTDAYTAQQYPNPPEPWRTATTDEWPAPWPAADLYRQGLLFHGPSYQVLDSIAGIGDRHVRGVMHRTEAPGSLLDGAGQMLGAWLFARYTTNKRILPYKFDRIRYFGPTPPVGEPVDCTVVIGGLSDDEVWADIQLTCRGRVWALIDGWHSRRFHDNPPMQETAARPQHNALSSRHEAGWTSYRMEGEELSTRDYIMGIYMSHEEVQEYITKTPPAAHRSWVIGRVAAKDAVRSLLWDDDPDRPIYPAQIGVGHDAEGRPQVVGRHGFDVGDIRVSIAHVGGVAVALARHGLPGAVPPGVDIETVAPMEATTVPVAFTDAEQRLIVSTAEAAGQAPEEWQAIFWTAKEAAAKSAGTGLRGAPHAFTVTAVDPAECRATVRLRADGSSLEVAFTTLAGAPGEPRYAVAWTTEAPAQPRTETPRTGRAHEPLIESTRSAS